jgi:hypothetical protein
MSEHIEHENGNDEAWICLCGNSPSDDGFYPIDEDNHEVEPTPSEWKTNQDCRQLDEDGHVRV